MFKILCKIIILIFFYKFYLYLYSFIIIDTHFNVNVWKQAFIKYKRDLSFI